MAAEAAAEAAAVVLVVGGGHGARRFASGTTADLANQAKPPLLDGAGGMLGPCG